MFECLEARLHTLPEAPTLRAANHEQLVEHYERMEALNADKIAPRFGVDPHPHDPDDEYDFSFFDSCGHHMLVREDYWRQRKLVWSWIDERPTWVSPVDWNLDVLPNPKNPSDPGATMQRQFRLTLLGGGQIKVVEHFRAWRLSPDEFVFGCDARDLRVTADAGAGLRRFTGAIDKHCETEMDAAAALFPPNTPQIVANRVAATFRLLTYSENVGSSVCGPDPENFAALLDRGARCCVCRRPLRDHVSTLLGIGPDCAKQFRMAHSLEAATRILQRRRELLGEES